MSFSRYNRLLILPFLLIIGALTIFSLWLEPLSGDLTRMGGYSERNFGWNLSQHRFEKPLFRMLKDTEPFPENEYFDMVILGDSFSIHYPLSQTNEGTYWPNYLANMTGMKILAINTTIHSFEDVINSTLFQKNPPKFFLYETVERLALSRLIAQKKCAKKTTPYITRETNPIYLHTLGNQPIEYLRPRWNGVQLGSVWNYLKKSFLRQTIADKSDVVRLPLYNLNSKIFSNRHNQEILLLGPTMNQPISEEQLEAFHCGISMIQGDIEKNNHSRLLLMIAPDKQSVYSTHIQSLSSTHLESLLRVDHPSIISIFQPLLNSIKNGEVDLYLPNDTHWGHTGHEIAAQAVFDHMVKNNWIHVSRNHRVEQ